MGLASRDFRFGMNNDGDHTIYLIVGAIVLVLILFITALINYSFSSAYLSDYVNNEGEVESKNIWQKIKIIYFKSHSYVIKVQIVFFEKFIKLFIKIRLAYKAIRYYH